MTDKKPMGLMTSGGFARDEFEARPTAFDRITFEPGKMGGHACIRGMRITVGLIVSLIAEGVGEGEILRDYPDLEREDIKQALAYAAWLAREEIVPV